MRPDMHKVLYQTRSRKEVRKPGRTQAPEELPKQEGIRSNAQGGPMYVHVGPLKRWLRSKVGKHWNEVHAELCSIADARSWPKARIRNTVSRLVQQRTYVKGREIWCVDEQYGEGKHLRIEEAPSRGALFYVHPRTGVLHEAPKSKPPIPWKVRAVRMEEVRRWVSDTLLLLKVNAIWHSLEMRSFKDADQLPPHDALFRLPLCQSHAREVYGKAAYCVEKRQTSRKELKEHGIMNSAEPRGIHEALGADIFGRMERSNGNPIRKSAQFPAKKDGRGGRFPDTKTIAPKNDAASQGPLINIS